MVEAVVGEIRPFAGNYAPEGWLVCKGQPVSVAQYELLFSLIGTIYGGDGRTNFNLPDLRGRVPVGQGQGTGLTNRIIGQKGGHSTITPTLANFPAHSHLFSVSGKEGERNAPSSNAALAVPQTQPLGVIYAYAPPGSGIAQQMDEKVITATGGEADGQVNVMPFLCINFIIATTGLYPEKQY